MACIVHSRTQNYIYERKTINTIKYNNYLVVFVDIDQLMLFRTVGHRDASHSLQVDDAFSADTQHVVDI